MMWLTPGMAPVRWRADCAAPRATGDAGGGGGVLVPLPLPPPAPGRSGLAVGGERDGNGIDAGQILHHLLGGLAERFELGGPGRIDGNGEIDLAAADDDLGDEPERDDVVAEIGPFDVLQRVEHALFEDGF